MSTTAKVFALSLTLLAGAAQLGCRACGTCHDYDPPVANCQCNACGTGRSGSAIGGYSGMGYASADEANADVQVAKEQGETTVR